jgi:thioesterase domain-containing protein
VEQLLFIQARESVNAAEFQVLESAVSQWKLLSRQPLAHIAAPGDHFSMLNQENARAVAEVLRAWMAQKQPVIRVA